MPGIGLSAELGLTCRAWCPSKASQLGQHLDKTVSRDTNVSSVWMSSVISENLTLEICVPAIDDH